MTRLEEAAIGLHRILWNNIGDSADWPVELIVSDDDLRSQIINALNKLVDAVEEIDPEECKWPIERPVEGL